MFRFNRDIYTGSGEREGEIVPAGLKTELRRTAGPADRDIVRAGCENPSGQRFVDKRPRGERELQMVVHALLERDTAEKEEKAFAAVPDADAVSAGGCLETDPDILKHLHECVMFAEIMGEMRGLGSVKQECHREGIVCLFLPAWRVFGRGHGDEVQNVLGKVAFPFRNLRLHLQRFTGGQPCRAHPRPVVNRERKIVRLPDLLVCLRCGAEPEISGAGCGCMAAEIFRADGKDDPAFFQDLLRGKGKVAREGMQMKRCAVADFRDEADAGKTSAGSALPLRSGKARFMRTVSGTVPDDRIIKLICFLNRAVAAFQKTVPQIHGMVMAA